VILGVPCNPYGSNVYSHVLETAARRRLPTRAIDMPSLTTIVARDGSSTVLDRHGEVVADALAPYLLFGFPAAEHAIRVLTGRAYSQNQVDAVLRADDKAATTVCLAGAGIAQIPTTVCRDDRDQVLAAAQAFGYPVVVKRTHGAQGRWVRRATGPAELSVAFDELMVEGPGALLVQPLVTEAIGTTIRVIVTGGSLLCTCQRTAGPAEWRSNIFGGASQKPVDLTPFEAELALGSAHALGLSHAGVDLLRTHRGSAVLEVNSCPDFTSMLPYFDWDLTESVVGACLPGGWPSAAADPDVQFDQASRPRQDGP
jgi:RimK family alpha-L-glutamate ligase